MTVFNFELLNVPFAVNAISSEVAPFPDYQRGLGISFEQTDGKPEMKGLNGLFQSITTSILYLKQRGIPEWDSALEYVANSSWVMRSGKLYRAIRNNTNKPPETSQSDWSVWASISDISVSTNGNLKKTVATDGSGAITLEVPTATDSQRGAMRFATASEVANKSNVSAAVKPSDVQSLTPIKAFCRVRTNNGNPVFNKNEGFASVTRVGGGVYEFVLSTAMPDTNYLILPSCSYRYDGSANSITIADGDFPQTTSRFRLICTFGGDNTLGAYDPAFINVTIVSN